jgi:hypothetical protein
MSTEQQQPVTPPTVDTPDTWGGASTAGGEWGQRQPRSKRRWSGRKLALAMAIAVGIAGAGGVAVYAASGSTSSTSSSQQGPGGGPGGGMGGGRTSGALHGEYVVSDGNGGYTTELLQNGEVTAVSDTSITARSEDGYTKTYTIDSETVVGNGSAELSSIAAGDGITIVATVSGDTATADSLVEAGTTTGAGQGQAPPDQDGSTQSEDTSGN